MNKTQALVITGVLLLTLNFALPILLGEFKVGFDVPLWGHVTLFDPSDAFGDYGFLIGGALAAVFMFVMISEYQKRRKRQ